LFRTRFKGSQFIVGKQQRHHPRPPVDQSQAYLYLFVLSVSLKDGLFSNANVLFRARFRDGTVSQTLLQPNPPARSPLTRLRFVLAVCRRAYHPALNFFAVRQRERGRGPPGWARRQGPEDGGGADRGDRDGRGLSSLERHLGHARNWLVISWIVLSWLQVFA
jgi:hypothetical protein